ncbi:MAG: RloB family protein [Anaerolineaceae bacterium]
MSMPHRNQLKERRPNHTRRLNLFEPRQSFLIVCEGEKTEPYYFSRFPIPQDSIVIVEGIGANTLSLVKETIRLKSEKKYNQVWCVFDMDSFSIENINSAIQLAERNGIKLAYSNEAFELWYILHFEYLNSGIDRQQYKEKLNRLLGFRYQKNNPQIYDLIWSRQKVAIRNARRLLSEYTNPHPWTNNPSTSVHLLVEQLNRLFWEE